MSLDEIIQIITANVDKVITMKYKSGEVDIALVQTVDDEGFVYELASVEAEDSTIPAVANSINYGGSAILDSVLRDRRGSTDRFGTKFKVAHYPASNQLDFPRPGTAMRKWSQPTLPISTSVIRLSVP